MKLALSFLVILVLLLVSVQSYSQEEEIDYCYKPSKPLFLSTSQSKKRYAEDLQEYQRCQQYFIDMKQRTSQLKKESEINEQSMMKNYMDHY